MTEKQKFSTMLTKVNDTYFPMIENQLVGNGINMDEYSKQCVMNAISAINNTLETAGVKWNDPQLDQSNVTQTLLHVASLKLNSSANPNEVFFQIRNVKRKETNEQGKQVEIWKKQIEMGIEGDGNDAILSRFGRNIKEVRQHWLVRENDEFSYPTFNGLDMEPPKWSPRGSGKVVKVVYPIITKSEAVEYHIAEREDVVRNLIAHINNNLMNETFGIAESRFKATAKQKEQINQKKKEIIDRVKELGLDAAIEDDQIQKHISPAWKDEQSKESMIIRKMRNNVVKRIPKDFGHALVEMSYDDSTNDYSERRRTIIDENANGEIIDVQPEQEHSEPKKEPENENTEPENEPEVEIIEPEQSKPKKKDTPF
jgi:hypothetical protein